MAILGSIIKRGIGLRHKIQIEWRSPERMQRRELKKLLRKAQYTLFGTTYRFSEMLMKPDFTTEFRNTVPVHDYNSIFSSWWNKCLHDEEDVCWPGKVKYFALSSGTSDASSKHIPVTRDMVRAIHKASIRQIINLANFNIPRDIFEKGILLLGGSTHLNQYGRYFEGDLSGITAKQVPFWFQHFSKPGRKIARQKDWNGKLEEITQQAKGWDIGIVVGVPSWVQLLMEKIIRHYNVRHIHEVWPNLTIYVHGGVYFEPYRKGFEQLLGRPLAYIETYLASEGFIAFQDTPGSKMRLILNNGIYYEFIPFTRENFDTSGELIKKPQTLTISEVEEGQDYALLLSTCAGAWRYLIGDTIRFSNKEQGEIKITGRTKHFLSLCGEHLSVDNMNKAIDLVSEEFNVSINEFVVSGIRHGSLFAHKWYVGTDHGVPAEVLRDRIDEHLKILNDDYRVERNSALKEVFVEVVPESLFYRWLESKGKAGAQNKFPRVMKAEAFAEWESFVARDLASSG